MVIDNLEKTFSTLDEKYTLRTFPLHIHSGLASAYCVNIKLLCQFMSLKNK